MTDSYMAGTTISRHVGELVPLTTEHYMAWHKSTNCIDQKSLTDHKPKRIRKYDGTHVNIASYITDSNMAGT